MKVKSKILSAALIAALAGTVTACTTPSPPEQRPTSTKASPPENGDSSPRKGENETSAKPEPKTETEKSADAVVTINGQTLVFSEVTDPGTGASTIAVFREPSHTIKTPLNPGSQKPVTGKPATPGDSDSETSVDPGDSGNGDPVIPDNPGPVKPGDGDGETPTDPGGGDGDGFKESSYFSGVYRPAGLNDEDVTDIRIGDFIRVYNEIRAAAGYDPVPVERFRIGLGDWSDNVVAHANGERRGHEGAVWSNEVASGLGIKTYYPEENVEYRFGAHSAAKGWWRSAAHRNIIYQIGAKASNVPDVMDENTCIVYNQAYTADGRYDARAAVVPCDNDQIKTGTVAAVDVNANLKDYVAPEKSDTEWEPGTQLDYDLSTTERGFYISPEQFQDRQDEWKAHVDEAREAHEAVTAEATAAAIEPVAGETVEEPVTAEAAVVEPVEEAVADVDASADEPAADIDQQ